MPSPVPRVLVFQHLAIEHPGVFRDFLDEDGVEWTAVELDEGEAIPALEDYDALWVMGGPMDVWEDEAYPWLEPEREAIREAVVQRKMPFLGICLGHQLLAQALGGIVGPADTPEIGVLDVTLTDAGQASPIFAGLPAHHACLQWHSSEVRQAPPGSRTLATSPVCAVQALAVADHAFSTQYHVEITNETVPTWNEVPEYARELVRALGDNAVTAFEASAAANMPDFNRYARCVYDNFMRIASGIRARASD